MQVLGLIPARGGSKAVTHKNLRPLAGHPLLWYTAEAARRSRRLSHVIISTDDPAVAEAAASMGIDVPFMRPAHLATDDAPILPVLQHAAGTMKQRGFSADVIVLLQPTSPLRRAEHIDAAVDLLVDSGADSVVSVVEVPHQFNPLSVLRLDDDRLRPFVDGPLVTRRQDKPRVFARNGPAVLAVKTSVLERGSLYGDDSRPLVMRADESIDIDDAADFVEAERMLRLRATG